MSNEEDKKRIEEVYKNLLMSLPDKQQKDLVEAFMKDPTNIVRFECGLPLV